MTGDHFLFVFFSLVIDSYIQSLPKFFRLQMTNIQSLHEDLLYLILSKCSSSIDMWHLLTALNYERIQRINLRAFWR